MRITICDDEKIFCEMISKYCKEILGRQGIKYEEDIFYSGVDLLESQSVPEILFLDIDMPQMDGIEVAEKICRLYPDCFIIFVTSYHDKARLGYKVNAHRFLFKPLDLIELEEALHTAICKLNKQRLLVLDERGTDKYIKISEIIYIESLGFGTAIYTKDTHYISKKTLNYYVKMFQTEGFYKIHKSFVISLGHIAEITNKSSVIMDNGIELPLSRRNKTGLKESMIKYVKYNAI